MIEIHEVYDKNDKKIELTQVLESGRVTLSNEIVEHFIEVSKDLKELELTECDLREAILTTMIANNIDKCEVLNVSFSQIIPKPKYEFDTDAFILNENTDFVNHFSDVTEVETFDIEKFKEECPDIYKKYVNTSTNVVVDTKRLYATFPEVYNKYSKEIPSKKEPSLRVTFKKEK